MSATVAHTANLPALTTVTNLVFQAAGVADADLVVTYNLKIDGQNALGYTTLRSDYRYTNGVTSDAGANLPIPGVGSGDYSITIPNGVAAAGTASRYFFRVSDGTTAAVVSGDYPAKAFTDLVTDASCNNCHGPTGIAAHSSFGYPGMTASQCVVCHKAGSIPGAPFPAPTTVDSWVNLVHGIHGSHDRPSGSYIFGTEEFEVTYPTYMTNCSVCHTEASGALAQVKVMPVTPAGCFSCHESMESWEFDAGIGFHEGYDESTNCAACHNGSEAPATIAAFHDGLETERVGIIYGGQDLSVSEGAKFNWTITKVVDDKVTGKLSISWTAEFPKGTPIKPCNTMASNTAPVFFPYGPNTAGEGTTSMLRSYAQGDDYVLGQANGPGQASAVNLSTTNTTCTDNVATTVIDRNNVPDGTRGIVALQGKPQLPVPAGMSTEHWAELLMFVRVPTPTYEYIVGTGAPATPRRLVADTKECLGCHVGSLYQHGNSRVDNVTMCIICHNSASSDQNNRVAMGVAKSEAYDGLVGQTYEFKTMLHAIHSAGEATGPFTIYRTRGIYAWAPEGVTPPNWASEPCEKATPTPGQEYRVFGGDPTLDVSCQAHTLYHPTYPRETNDCAACHVADFSSIPDQAKAVATTLDAGMPDTGTTNVWKNQLDDTLQGASAAACTSCHSTAPARGHAYQNGWTPQTFEQGRQTILDTR